MTLADRLRRALARECDDAVLLAGDGEEWTFTPDPAEAAVLIPVTEGERPGVILTRRADTMRRHAGQVAFPGGRIDPGEDPVTAALREAEEEIALPRGAVEVIGATDPYRTATGYRITPVVGVVAADLPLIASEAEVAEMFEVPLDFLLDPANQRRASAMWQGRERHFYEIMWEDRRIWGATAGVIVNLSRRLQWT